MEAIINYFSELNIFHLFGNMPSALTQGLIYGILAIGVFITFRILNIADLTVDGSFATGGAVTIMMMLAGYPVWLSLIVAVLAGIAAGAVTGIIHTLLGIPAILAGILSQLGLYSINLVIMKMSPNRAINSSQRGDLIMTGLNLNRSIIFGLVIVVLLIALLYWFFGTELGSAIRATGNNIAMSQAQGININYIVLGLALSNGIVLCGKPFSQYQGADINMGRGTIVIGLAAVIIGEVLGDALFKKRMNFALRLTFLAVGGIIYQFIISLFSGLSWTPIFSVFTLGGSGDIPCRSLPKGTKRRLSSAPSGII